MLSTVAAHTLHLQRLMHCRVGLVNGSLTVKALILCLVLLQVLVPTSQFIRSLVAARLAADVLDVPTVLIARTDAHSAALLTSDVDEVDRAFCTGERTPEGFYRVKEGVKVSKKLSFVPWVTACSLAFAVVLLLQLLLQCGCPVVEDTGCLCRHPLPVD